MKKYTYTTYNMGFKVSEEFMETDQLISRIQDEEDKKALERIRKRMDQLFNSSSEEETP